MELRSELGKNGGLTIGFECWTEKSLMININFDFRMYFINIHQVFRIARIMRIFKLARRSVGLQSIAYTVKTSYKVLNIQYSIIQCQWALFLPLSLSF